MSPAQFVLLVALAAPSVVSQGNGWPEWPEWPSGDWPEWPEWPAWKESSADTTPTPVPTAVPVPVTMEAEEEDAAMAQVSDLFEAVNVTMDAEEEEDAAMAQVSDLFEAVNVTTDAEEEAAATAQVSDLVSGYATVVEALADREDLSLFYEVAFAVDHLQVFQDKDFSTTIFVPTNAAMSKAIAALGFLSFDDFLVLKNMKKVVEILAYHTVKDTVFFSGDLEDGAFLNMLNGPVLNTQVDLSDGVAIRGIGSVANVVEADIVAGKSVIHIIDTVLLPFDPVIESEINNALQDLSAFGEFESIMQLVEAVPSLSIFSQAAEVAGMYPFLQARNFKGSMFIPSDDAFSKGLQNLGLTSLEDLLNDSDLVETILVNHIMNAPLIVSQLQNDQILETVGQQTVTVNGAAFLAIDSNGAPANVIDYNIMAGEVVVHIIDDVLLPWEVTDDMLEKINATTLFK